MQTCQRQKGKAVHENQRSTATKSSSSQTTFLYIYESESDSSWMDKLLPHRKHESVHERVWRMAATQDTSSHNQTVEKANENLYESAENQQEIQMQFYRRRYIQGGKLKTWIISTMWNERNQLYHQSKSAGHTKSRETRISQSAGILSKIAVNLMQM